MKESAGSASAPVTALDLARLEELEGRATPGPWTVRPDGWQITAPDNNVAGFHNRVTIHDGGRPTSGNEGPADAEFIAALRNAAPSLLAAARAVVRVRALHRKESVEGYAAVCIDGDCEHGSVDCPISMFDVCAECYSLIEALSGFADSGECWPAAVLWPCPTVAALDGGDTK